MPELSPGAARQATVALATGLRLHVVEWGAADGWPLVILHGGGHHAGCWAEVCRRLPPELRCIVPDQRGHGASDRSATGDYSCAAQGGDLVALLRELAVERCALVEVRRRVIGTLSKGFKQRVGLAQAIVHDPPVLILDEPTIGLDPLQVREIRGLIAELAAPEKAEQQQTVILSTHILAEVEAICRRVILISEGRKAVDALLADLTAGGHRLEEIFTRQTSRDALEEQEGER